MHTRTYDDLIMEAHKLNRITMATIESFEQIIEVANRLGKEYEDADTDVIDFISIAYPRCADDYLMIIIYLAEKGSIVRDFGTFVDELISETGLEFVGEVVTDPDNQIKRWDLIDKTKSYSMETDTDIRHPRVTIKVDAKKSKACIRRKTGRMIPEYEFVCEEE